MKKIILGSVVASIALFATNGDNLIGLDAKSRAMGGVGIATYFGASNALTNPALLTNNKSKEFNFSIMHFAPDVKVNGVDSDADQNFIPNISLSNKIDSKWSYSIGAYGIAGMGVDFRGTNKNFNSRSDLALLKIAPSIAYNEGRWSFGVTPIVQYGTLQITLDNPATPATSNNDKSDDIGLGYKIGATFNVSENSRLGFVYQSGIKMNYEEQIGLVAPGFGLTHIDDDLEQPAEFGIGYSVDYNNITFAIDYKNVQWAESEGYEDFKWNNQNIYSVGLKYEANGTWFALGYNYAKSPITEQDATIAGNAAINTFNNMVFPATSVKHYTAGFGMNISKNFALGLGVVYSANAKTNVTGTNGAAPAAVKSEHSELSESLTLTYKF